MNGLQRLSISTAFDTAITRLMLCIVVLLASPSSIYTTVVFGAAILYFSIRAIYLLVLYITDNIDFFKRWKRD